MDRIEEAKQKRIIDLLAIYSIPWKKAGAKEIKIVCPSAEHKDTDASCFINTDKNLFKCHGCNLTGSSIDFVMMVEGCSAGRAIDVLVGEKEHSEPKKQVRKEAAKKKYQPSEEHQTKRYDYTDEKGKKAYASIRYDYPDGSKEFRMATYNGNVLNLGLKGDVPRVPYMLDEFPDWPEVWFGEGEKVADALTELGIFCTCVAGGSNAKLDGVVKYFAGKDVVLLPDNDDTGRKFMAGFSEMLYEVARSVRTLDVGTMRNPKGYDAYDKIQDLKRDGLSQKEIRERLEIMKRASRYEVEGVPVEALSNDQSEAHYQLMLLHEGFDLGDFIPSLKGVVRPLIPSDCLCITGATASGKTSMLAALGLWASPKVILVFNIELSTGVLFERSVSGASEVPAADVEPIYKSGRRLCINGELDHIYTVPVSRLTPDEVRRQFYLFVKLHKKWPNFVEIDYVQLMKGKGPRYEQTSDNAEEIRILAKELDTIMVFTSQKSRFGANKKEDEKPSLGDAKGSGSLENSASVYMDLRPHPTYPDVKVGTILKNTRGPAGIEFEIGWKGECTKFIAGALSRPDEPAPMMAPPPDHSEPARDEDGVPF